MEGSPSQSPIDDTSRARRMQYKEKTTLLMNIFCDLAVQIMFPTKLSASGEMLMLATFVFVLTLSGPHSLSIVGRNEDSISHVWIADDIYVYVYTICAVMVLGAQLCMCAHKMECQPRKNVVFVFQIRNQHSNAFIQA